MFFFGQWWEISLESFSELQYLIDFLWFLDQMCTPCEIVNDDDEDEGDDVGHDDFDDIYIMMQCLFVCHEKWALS